MSLVAYVAPSNIALREAAQSAQPTNAEGKRAQVVFRDPATFEPADADPLDTVIHMEEPDSVMAGQIRAAYAAVGVQVAESFDAPAMPPPGEMPAGRIGRRNIASTEPKAAETPV